jgi:hypothetical protein
MRIRIKYFYVIFWIMISAGCSRFELEVGEPESSAYYLELQYLVSRNEFTQVSDTVYPNSPEDSLSIIFGAGRFVVYSENIEKLNLKFDEISYLYDNGPICSNYLGSLIIHLDTGDSIIYKHKNGGMMIWRLPQIMLATNNLMDCQSTHAYFTEVYVEY